MARIFANIDNPKGFFFPGEVIAGRVTVIFDKVVKVKKIILQFKGGSFVKWIDTDRKYYSDGEAYFDINLLLMKPPEFDEYNTLQPGEYHYPFQFKLPPDLPPSFRVTILKDGATADVDYVMEIKASMKPQMNVIDVPLTVRFFTLLLAGAPVPKRV
jgi:hypothetical protein